jgi:hypothetical protein
MSKSNVLSDKPIVKAHPTTGQVVTYFQSEKGETFGKIRVDQSAPVINNGFLSFANRSAFITMDEETAKKLEPILKEEQPYPIAGKVLVRESTEPFYEGQEAKINPSTEEVITHLGAPVYRDTEFTSDINAQDVLLQSDRDGVTAEANAQAQGSETPE